MFDVALSVVEDTVDPGSAANVVVGEPSSDMFSVSKSSSRIAVIVKSVPEPVSGAWLKVRARSAPIALR